MIGTFAGTIKIGTLVIIGNSDQGLPLSKEACQSTAQLTFPEMDNENPLILTAMPHESGTELSALATH